MKKALFIILIALPFLTLGQQKQNVIKSNYLDGFVNIKGADFKKSSGVLIDTPNNNDTTLVCGEKPYMQSVADFAISDHEVTNAEYRAFVYWVRDSIARSKLFRRNNDPKEKRKWGKTANTYTGKVDSSGQNYLLNWESRLDYEDPEISFLLSDMFYSDNRFYKRRTIDTRLLYFDFYWIENKDTILERINVYPDTTCWHANKSSYISDNMIFNYFWHSYFDDYPVVGLTYHQIRAYLSWRTDRYLEECRKSNKKNLFSIKFRLPTENEWEYAATGKYHYTNGYEMNKSGYASNFGSVTTQTGLVLKYPYQDGSTYTNEVQKYLSNPHGLYDIYGNVAEWTSTVAPDTISLYQNIMNAFYFPVPNQVFGGEKKGIVFPKHNSENNTHIYITDPYTKQTLHVNKRSKEHEDIVKRRVEYYAAGPNDTFDELKRKFLEFHSIDKKFDSIIRTNLDPELEGDVITSGVYDYLNLYSDTLKRIPLYNNIEGTYVDLVENAFFDPEIDYIDPIIRRFIHNRKVLHRAKENQIKNNRSIFDSLYVVKGGSWMDEPHFICSGAKEIYPDVWSSSKIGFRVATSIDYTIPITSLEAKKQRKTKRTQKKSKTGWEWDPYNWHQYYYGQNKFGFRMDGKKE